MTGNTLAGRILLPLLVLLTSGCLIVPHRAVRLHGVIVPQTATTTIQPGASTREDVLHCLGRPERVEENGRYFIYQWTMSYATLVVAASAGYSGSMVAVPVSTETHFLCLEFAPDGRLLRSERLHDASLFKSLHKTVDPWMNQSTPHPPGVSP